MGQVQLQRARVDFSTRHPTEIDRSLPQPHGSGGVGDAGDGDSDDKGGDGNVDGDCSDDYDGGTRCCTLGHLWMSAPTAADPQSKAAEVSTRQTRVRIA